MRGTLVFIKVKFALSAPIVTILTSFRYRPQGQPECNNGCIFVRFQRRLVRYDCRCETEGQGFASIEFVWEKRLSSLVSLERARGFEALTHDPFGSDASAQVQERVGRGH
jgi:hypothetical protein